ncbi:MAG: glycosyl hydrolase 43 family protein, partial [Bacteroidota bacterium]
PGRILSSNDSVKGPGHASFFRDVAGDSWIAYHGWDPGLNKRYPRLDRVRITEGTIRPVDPGYALPTRE